MWRVLRFLTELRSLPRATIRVSGNELCKGIFANFTMPHPKYKVIRHKRWGVGLLPLPDRFEDYLQGKHKETVRRQRRRAATLGYEFRRFDPFPHLDEIMDINKSLPVRQGATMSRNFVDRELVQASLKNMELVYGIFDVRKVLRAYAHTPVCGEFFYFSRILGHAADLDHGIMYMLVSEVVREMIARKRDQGMPLWAMYDTFFGATAGLRSFKERVGFLPYNVRWVWEEGSASR